jgi:hypothetical protein
MAKKVIPKAFVTCMRSCVRKAVSGGRQKGGAAGSCFDACKAKLGKAKKERKQRKR